MTYDLLLIHPPSVYDFRKRVIFLGPITRTVPYTPVFIMFPVGLLSIADFLDRHGYKVKVVNLGEKMLSDGNFDVEGYLKTTQSRVYGIDLHWCIHSQGAIEIARLCKKLHQDSITLLGGMTATYFDTEIISTYPFIDYVMKGEAEEPMLKFMQELDKDERFDETPNLTFRDENGKIRINHPMKVSEDLDRFEFTRLDLVEPCERVLTTDVGLGGLKLWNIPVYRGCIFNCITCGGSAYSYQNLMKRSNLALRSPEKILEDFQRLDEQKLNSVFLFQDMRVGGQKYWRKLLALLDKEKWSHIDHVTIELFYPPEEDFLRVLSEHKPAEEVGMGISPETGDENVRKAQGRICPNDSLFETVKACKKYGLSLAAFFMIGLAEESVQTIENMWSLWEKLLQMNEHGQMSVGVGFCPMIFLDPGSLAFDQPEKYGYALNFRTLDEHIRGMSFPSWKYWISYETRHLKREHIVDLTLKSSERLVNLYEKYGFTTQASAKTEKVKIGLERIILRDVDEILKIKDEAERQKRLKELDLIVKSPSLAYSYLLSSDEGWEVLKQAL